MNVFSLSFEEQFCWLQNSWLAGNYFSYSTLNMIFYFLLGSVVSEMKSTVNQIIASLYKINSSSFCALIFLNTFEFDTYKCDSLSFYPMQYFIDFLGSVHEQFSSNLGRFQPLIFNKLFPLFLSLCPLCPGLTLYVFWFP